MLKYTIVILTMLLAACIANSHNKDAKQFEITYETYEDFETFYTKFKSDSIFQMTRIKFPIKGQYESYEIEREWTKEKWPLMTWDYREEIKNTDDSISIIQDSLKLFFGTYCRGCGFSFEMQFDNVDGQWYLTYRQENNY